MLQFKDFSLPIQLILFTSAVITFLLLYIIITSGFGVIFALFFHQDLISFSVSPWLTILILILTGTIIFVILLLVLIALVLIIRVVDKLIDHYHRNKYEAISDGSPAVPKESI